MILFSFFFIVSVGLVVLLKLVSFFISESCVLNREELSSYECGFEHHNLSRLPFSFRYFLLTLVFLLFDLEIVLLLFVVYCCYTTLAFLGLLFVLLIVLIFIVGLFFELKEGALDWIS